MKRRTTKTLVGPMVRLIGASLCWLAILITPAIADDQTATPVKTLDDSKEILYREDDGWKIYNTRPGWLHRRELTIYPSAEPSTHDSVRLLPNADEMRDANAAIWYLKALGFFERTAAQSEIGHFHAEQADLMSKDPEYDAAPWSWLSMPPSELPIQEVQKYLSYSDFQRELLFHAARCRSFDLDRNIEEIEEVADYSLAEIPALQQLARNQSLRCRLAIAEGDFAPAASVIGENFQLARQLSNEPFLVSTLVGMRIAESSFQDANYFVAQPNSPNLYWAIAELPNPLVEQSRGVELETDLLLHQVRPLRKIGLVPLTDMDWSEFLTEIMPMMGDEGDFAESYKSNGMLGATLFIASAGEEVESFLLNECGITQEQIEALPATQAFFLAVRRMFEDAGRESNHLYHAPTSAKNSMISSIEERRNRVSQQYPMLSDTIEWIIPRVTRSVIQETWRLQQRLALLQTIEALRDHLATHDSHWPAKLIDLALPAPHDPVTGQPFAWSVDHEKATLSAASNGAERLEIILEIGKSPNVAPQESIDAPAPETSRSKWQVSFQIDENASLSSIFTDRILDRLSPSERKVWAAIERTVQTVARDKTNGAGELLRSLFPPFLADADPRLGDQRADQDESLSAALKSVADLPIHWVVVLPQTFREVFSETRPSIDPDSPASPSLSWIADVKWVSIGIDSDQGIVKAILQCEDAEAAKQARDRLPDVAMAFYHHWVNPEASELSAKEESLFASEVIDDRVTFTVGGDDQNADGLISLIRLLSVGFENSLNDRVEQKMSVLMRANHDYYSAYDRVPPFAQGTDYAKRLGLSWRVYLLPFVGDGKYVSLFKKFHLDEPWDSEHNLKLVKEIPELYQSPMGAQSSNAKEGLTTLVAPTSERSFLGGKQERSFQQIIDGLANTLAVVEVHPELAVPWTKPADYAFDPEHPAAGLMVRDGKTVVAAGDGWSGALPIGWSDEDWRALFSIDGRERITDEFYRLRE